MTRVEVSGREAIGDALRLLLRQWDAGDIVSFSLEVPPHGVARFTTVFARLPPGLPGIEKELDEEGDDGQA